MAVEVWLVRHGHTEWSEAGRYTGWTDIALTPEGEAQARSLASMLPTGPDVTAWSSDLSRCARTAQLAGLEPMVDRRLRELDFGAIEGLTWDEVPVDLQEALMSFDDFAAPDGESVVDFGARVSSFLDELSPGRHVVVTHGGVLRLLLRAAGRDIAVAPGHVERITWS